MLVASDVMVEDVVTAEPDWNVGKVVDLMLSEDVSSLLVVDRRDRVVGIVTESALLVAIFDAQLRSDPISLHMQRNFIGVGPDEPIDRLVEQFLLHRVRHFPVLQGDKLIGIVTRRQLMRSVWNRKGELNRPSIAG